MMGERSGSQGRFFYRFDLEKRVPADHLLRKIDAVLDLKQQAIPCGFRVRVTEQHQNLELYKLQLMTVEQHFYVLKG